MFKEKVKLSIDNFEEFVNDDDYKNSLCTVDFLSTRPNSHRHIYSEEVLKKYGDTVLGAWLIAEYSDTIQDVTTHTDKQVIIGQVPIDQTVQYRYDEDGYLVASVDVIMSKLYAKDVYDLFRVSNERAVSCELVAIGDKQDDGSAIIEEYDICGITVLGLSVNPSVPNSKINVVKFSSDEACTDFEQLSKIKYSKSQGDIVDKINSIETKVDLICSTLSQDKEINKEETMKKKAVKFAIEIGDGLWCKLDSYIQENYPSEEYWAQYCIKGIYEENGEKFVILLDRHNDGKLYKVMLTYTETEFSLSKDFVEVAETFVEADGVTTYSEEEVSAYEESKKAEAEELAKKDSEEKEEGVVMGADDAKDDETETETEDDKVNDAEADKMADDVKTEEMACGDKKMAEDAELAEPTKEEYTQEISELKLKVEAYEKELAELREFKAEVLSKETDTKTAKVLSELKDKITTESYAKLEEGAKECSYETVDAWADKAYGVYGKESITLSKENGKEEVVKFGADLYSNEVSEGIQATFERCAKYL